MEEASGGVWHEVLDTNTNCVYYWNQQDNITSWVLPTNASVVKLHTTDTGKVIVARQYYILLVPIVCWYVCMFVCPDQMDAAATTVSDSVTEETIEEELVEYGPHLPEDYIPPSNDQSSSSDVSSRKRPNMDDDGTQDIDNMLDDALEVKRARLDEGR